MKTLVDCGCETKVHKDGSGVEVYMCPLHAAAPELLDAAQDFALSDFHEAVHFLTELRDRLEEEGMLSEVDAKTFDRVLHTVRLAETESKMAKAAIAKATGQ